MKTQVVYRTTSIDRSNCFKYVTPELRPFQRAGNVQVLNRDVLRHEHTGAQWTRVIIAQRTGHMLWPLVSEVDRHGVRHPILLL